MQLRTLFLVLIVQLGGCTQLNYNNVQSYHLTLPPSHGIVCDDPMVMYLDQYRHPPPPSMDDIPLADREGEILALLNYIDQLKAELSHIARDYGCVTK